MVEHRPARARAEVVRLRCRWSFGRRPALVWAAPGRGRPVVAGRAGQDHRGSGAEGPSPEPDSADTAYRHADDDHEDGGHERDGDGRWSTFMPATSGRRHGCRWPGRRCPPGSSFGRHERVGAGRQVRGVERDPPGVHPVAVAGAVGGAGPGQHGLLARRPPPDEPDGDLPLTSLLVPVTTSRPGADQLAVDGEPMMILESTSPTGPGPTGWVGGHTEDRGSRPAVAEELHLDVAPPGRALERVDGLLHRLVRRALRHRRRASGRDGADSTWTTPCLAEAETSVPGHHPVR